MEIVEVFLCVFVSLEIEAVAIIWSWPESSCAWLFRLYRGSCNQVLSLLSQLTTSTSYFSGIIRNEAFCTDEFFRLLMFNIFKAIMLYIFPFLEIFLKCIIHCATLYQNVLSIINIIVTWVIVINNSYSTV